MGQTSLLEVLNVRVVGSGDRFLVLSHGFGTDQSAWQKVLPYLARDHKVVLYDLVCAGSVDPDNFDFDRYAKLDAYAEDVLNILSELRIRQCVFVGHSMSAMIGCLAAIRHPELFSKLILIGGSPRYLNDNDYHGGFEVAEMEKVLSAMGSNYEAWVNGFAPLAVGADVPVAVREFSRTLFNMRPDISLFVSQMVFLSDLRSRLSEVNVPCCIIQSVKDISAPLSVATYLKNNLGGRTTIEMLHTEGHLPHLSAPQVLVQVLRRALAHAH